MKTEIKTSALLDIVVNVTAVLTAVTAYILP